MSPEVSLLPENLAMIFSQ